MQSQGAKKYFTEKKGEIQKANKKKSTYAFEFLSPNKLPAGTYFFRLLSKHPEKCPAGEEYLSTIKLPDPSSPYGLQLLLGDSDGHEERCWFSELIKALEKNGRMKKLPQVVREALAEALDPFERLRYPTAWFLDITTKEVKAPTKKDPDAVRSVKTYSSNIEREQEQGIILDVWQKGINEEIQNAIEAFDDIRDPDTGRLLKLTVKGEGKTRKYNVSVSKKKPLLNKALNKKLYPDMAKFVESMVKDYESQRLLFIERMDPMVIKALEAVGINLESPLEAKASSKKAMKAMAEEDYDEFDDEDEEEEDEDIEEDEEEEEEEDEDEDDDEWDGDEFEDDDDDEDIPF